MYLRVNVATAVLGRPLRHPWRSGLRYFTKNVGNTYTNALVCGVCVCVRERKRERAAVAPKCLHHAGVLFDIQAIMAVTQAFAALLD